MKNKIALSTLFLLLILVLAAIGPTTPAETPGQEGGAQPPVEGPDRSASETATGEALETFVPTEKLPADSAISFPVDI